MPSEQTKQLCKLTKDQLRDIKEELDNFLSYVSIPQLLEDGQVPEEKVEYIREFLRDLRHLSVA